MQGMTRLGGEELAARAGHEPTTAPEELHGRAGYQSDFLDGWRSSFPARKATSPGTCGRFAAAAAEVS